jgi:hypothetical protein
MSILPPSQRPIDRELCGAPVLGVLFEIVLHDRGQIFECLELPVGRRATPASTAASAAACWCLAALVSKTMACTPDGWCARKSSTLLWS